MTSASACARGRCQGLETVQVHGGWERGALYLVKSSLIQAAIPKLSLTATRLKSQSALNICSPWQYCLALSPSVDWPVRACRNELCKGQGTQNVILGTIFEASHVFRNPTDLSVKTLGNVSSDYLLQSIGH